MKKNILIIGLVVIAFCVFISVTLYSQTTYEISKTSQTSSATSTDTSSVPQSQNDMLPVHTVGQVTWHPDQFVGKQILISGYLLKKESGYIVVSDEPSGVISAHDLPIAGEGIDTVESKHKYLFEGVFLGTNLKASSNMYHMELSHLPKPLNQ